MQVGRWRRVSKKRPCPICGRAEFCGLLEDPSRGGAFAARCADGRWLRPLPGYPQPGWIESPKGVDADGCLTFFLDDGTRGSGAHGAKPLSAAEREAFARAQRDREAYEESKRRAAIAAARSIWRSAAGTPDQPTIIGAEPGCPDGRGVDHPRVRGYLAARGVLLDRLPRGKVPASIRYLGACPHEHQDAEGRQRKDRLPALVACFTDHQRACTAVQRIYLDVLGAHAKCAGIDPVKQTRGSLSSGQAVRLTGSNAGGDGTLIIAEGIETALAVLCAVGDGKGLCRAAVWSVLSTSGLKGLQLRDVDVIAEAGGWIRRVVVAADLDRAHAGKRAGTDAGRVLAQRMLALWPEVNVAVVPPQHAHAPTLVTEDGEVAAAGDKSVDWLDVLRARGPDVVAEALLGSDLRRGDEPLAFLPKQRTARARVVLTRIFSPKPPPQDGHGPAAGHGRGGRGGRAGMVFGLRRFAAKWWVRRDGARPRWADEEDDERLVARVGALFDEYVERLADGTVRPSALSGGQCEDVLRAVVTYTSVDGQNQPCWLPAQFDRLGRPDWHTTIHFGDHEVDAPMRQDGSRVAATDVIAFPNCLLDVGAWERGELRTMPVTPRFFSRSCLPFPLPVEDIAGAARDGDDAGGELWSRLCPRWLDFLGQTFDYDDESIRQLQRWFGYCLTSDIRYEKLLWLQGPPGSGKGTITKMLEAVVGDDNVAQTDLDKLGQRFGLASLVGRSLITMPELRVGFRTDTALGLSTLLSISAGDALTIEDKFARARAAVRITGKIMVTPNEEPNLRDAASALTRRLLVIPTLRPAENPDPLLKSRLMAEASGVMVWALFGLLDLRRAKGFQQPSAGEEIVREMRRGMSPVIAFVEDECVVGAGNSVLTSALYACYCAYTERAGGKPESRSLFGTRLKAAVARVDRVDVPGRRGEHMYVGVRPRVAGVDVEDETKAPVGHVTLIEDLQGEPIVRGGRYDLAFAPARPHAP